MLLASRPLARIMQIPAELEIARGLPPSGCTVAVAERYTRLLATSHYENFNVVSSLLPRRLHQHFYNLYAYCRWADDLGDEISDPQKALALLNEWDQELRDCYAGEASHPVFIALRRTIYRAGYSHRAIFLNLLIAFRHDQTVRRYATWNDVFRVLPLFCESRRAIGTLSLRLSRRAAPAAFRRHLHGVATGEFLAGHHARP